MLTIIVSTNNILELCPLRGRKMVAQKFYEVVSGQECIRRPVQNMYGRVRPVLYQSYHSNNAWSGLLRGLSLGLSLW